MARETFYNEAIGRHEEYDHETGYTAPMRPRDEEEYLAMQGACPYCGDHHGDDEGC